MGLDTVELVMAVEEEFGIVIPNDRAATIVTLGDLRDLVVAILPGRSAEINQEFIWDRITEIERRDFAIPKRHLIPEAAIVADLGLD